MVDNAMRGAMAAPAEERQDKGKLKGQQDKREQDEEREEGEEEAGGERGKQKERGLDDCQQRTSQQVIAELEDSIGGLALQLRQQADTAQVRLFVCARGCNRADRA
jgi:hypothetical protein